MKRIILIAALICSVGCSAIQARRAVRAATKTMVAICELEHDPQWCATAGNLALFVDSMHGEGGERCSD